MLWDYLEWDTAVEGVSYFRWRRPKLSELEEDLLSGVCGVHSSFEFHADVNHHSCYAKILAPDTPLKTYVYTPISLIVRAAMSLMKFSGRMPQTLTVRPFLPFAWYVLLTSTRL